MKSIRSLDDFSFENPIDAREGVSIDHLCRARVHFLVTQDRSFVSQTQFADAKAAAVMTLMGLVLLNNPTGASWTGGDPLGLLVFIASVLAILLALWAVTPRFPTGEVRQEITSLEKYSWPALADADRRADEYIAFVLNSQHAQLIASLARSNCASANILLRKFRALRASFLAAGVALVVFLIRELIQLV